MRHSVRISALAAAVCAGVFASFLFAADGGKFAVKKKATLGGDGGWDYLTWDAAGKRLFIARATRVMVVDAASGKQIGEIANTEGVHGIALVPELGKGFTSNGRENTATVIFHSLWRSAFCRLCMMARLVETFDTSHCSASAR